MTKKEFAKLKQGQLIIVIIKKGKKTIRQPFTIPYEPSIVGGSLKMMTYSHGLLNERDVDFLNASDVYAMMDEEAIRHNKRQEELNKLLREVSQ